MYSVSITSISIILSASYKKFYLFNDINKFNCVFQLQVWLQEKIHLRIEGHIVGFDEYMNLVLDEACEVNTKVDSRKPVGRILLKGENITLIQNMTPSIG